MEEELRDLRNLKGKATPGELLEKEFVHAVQGGGDFDHGINLPDLDQEKMPALIKVVCSLVSRRPQIPYTVEELATAARLTSNYFSSMFHKYTGQCFVDYLTDRRIDRAKTLLSDPSLNISEISSMCGYDDPGYFARRFRKKTGVTPRAWREKGDKAIPKKK
jgi:two-component system response regulator YesN